MDLREAGHHRCFPRGELVAFLIALRLCCTGPVQLLCDGKQTCPNLKVLCGCYDQPFAGQGSVPIQATHRMGSGMYDGDMEWGDFSCCSWHGNPKCANPSSSYCSPDADLDTNHNAWYRQNFCPKSCEMYNGINYCQDPNRAYLNRTCNIRCTGEDSCGNTGLHGGPSSGNDRYMQVAP